MKKIPAIYERVSVRSFKNKAIPKNILHEMITAGTMAPASGNMQPWEFVVIDEAEKKEQVVGHTFSGFYSKGAKTQDWMKDAGVIIVICTNFKRTVARYGALGHKWAPLDTASAVQNILLTATENGLAGCWVGGFHEEEISKLLGIPQYVKPIGLLPIGYPNKNTEPKQKIPAKWMTHHNHYNQPYFT